MGHFNLISQNTLPHPSPRISSLHSGAEKTAKMESRFLFFFLSAKRNCKSIHFHTLKNRKTDIHLQQKHRIKDKQKKVKKKLYNTRHVCAEMGEIRGKRRLYGSSCEAPGRFPSCYCQRVPEIRMNLPEMYSEIKIKNKSNT